MKKIGTHDSATGERGYGLSPLVTLFAMTQSKTIKEQLEAGVRYFDIRVRKTRRGWICAHGIWTTRKSADEILAEIDSYKGCYVNVTYEGWGHNDYEKMVDEWVAKYRNIKFAYINIKYTEGLKLKWKCLKVLNRVKCEDHFFKLDFRSWHTFLPIPILWKQFYFKEVTFNVTTYRFVDFV